MNIILVAGPSGSGKDTLLRNARIHFSGNGAISFARRYITRPPDDNEDNYYLDTIGFKHLEKSGFFLSCWQAHRNYYGIAEHMAHDTNSYTTLVCSVSRGAVIDFDRRYPNTLTVNVTVEEDILKERLLARGRENEADIEKRLARATKKITARNLILFDNSGPLQESCAKFIDLLEQASLNETTNAQALALP